MYAVSSSISRYRLQDRIFKSCPDLQAEGEISTSRVEVMDSGIRGLVLFLSCIAADV